MTAADAEVGTRPQDPPVLVAATVGEVTAVWQVEVDARVLLGDFSGAWLVDADGIRGFAAEADWIDQRSSRDGMLELLLARPVILAGDGGSPVDPADPAVGDLPAGVRIVDVAATVAQAASAVERNREDFATADPGKRQPGWAGAWDDAGFTPVPGRAPEHLDGDAAEAVIRAMAAARGLRGLVQRWNALDKLRVQRLGGALHPLPLVLY
ncbi:hypothetical protein [Corynebacterium terpenotabidum]|uniref:N-acetylglucosamine-6-phosphate deacetylase n=1 Tax=Corynebacterium terpenotabidum Y-11 TaxID=1200352 RepID=S4XAX1_9CORY|nr:hypothetical protein [Corynebacterium terpenotabidum]AGP29771.1 N-acetylglucosamine-6-phosphate deacetylase [Corynebacterium terpenotabidum Y-11]